MKKGIKGEIKIDFLSFFLVGGGKERGLFFFYFISQCWSEFKYYPITKTHPLLRYFSNQPGWVTSNCFLSDVKNSNGEKQKKMNKVCLIQNTT